MADQPESKPPRSATLKITVTNDGGLDGMTAEAIFDDGSNIDTTCIAHNVIDYFFNQVVMQSENLQRAREKLASNIILPPGVH